MERMTITLTDEIAARVKEAVEMGQYGSVSELVRQALRDWEMAEARRAHELKVLRDEVRVGMEQAASGEARPFDAERIIGLGKNMTSKKS